MGPIASLYKEKAVPKLRGYCNTLHKKCKTVLRKKKPWSKWLALRPGDRCLIRGDEARNQALPEKDWRGGGAPRFTPGPGDKPRRRYKQTSLASLGDCKSRSRKPFTCLGNRLWAFRVPLS